MGLQNKLWSILGAMLLAFLLLSGFLTYQLHVSSDNVRRLYQQDFLPTDTVNRIDGSLTRIDINILRMLAIGNPNSIAGWKRDNEAAFLRVNQAFGELSEQLANQPQAAMVADLAAAYDRLRAGMTHQTEVIQQGNIPQAAQINLEEVKPHAERVFAGLEQLRNTGVERADRRMNDQLEETRSRLWLTIIVILLIGSASLLVSWRVIRSIMAEIGGEPRVVARLTSAIAAGDLTNVITLRQGAEKSVMASVNDMQRQLRDTLQRISRSAGQLSTSAGDLQRISEANGLGVAKQDAEVEQAATAVTEMTSAIEEVARSAEHTSRCSQQAAGSVQEGQQQVVSTSQVVGEMVDSVGIVTQEIRQLATRSRDIGRVLDVIRGLAEQTNLLALNAAIEAARAGEAGRGFAVVADEVRALAHRTQSSTREIEQMVDSIQVGSNQAEQAIEVTSALSDRTLSATNKAREALNVINQAVGEMNQLNLAIASAGEEQAHVAREVDRNLVNIRDLSNQSLQSAEAVTQSSRTLNRLASELTDVVANFRL